MKLLLDENLPRALRRSLAPHEVSDVVYAGWSGLKNGELLRRAERDFDVFLTMDANLPFQQRLDSFDLRFVVLHATSNELHNLRPLVPQILQCLENLLPGQVVHIQS